MSIGITRFFTVTSLLSEVTERPDEARSDVGTYDLHERISFCYLPSVVSIFLMRALTTLGIFKFLEEIVADTRLYERHLWVHSSSFLDCCIVVVFFLFFLGA